MKFSVIVPFQRGTAYFKDCFDSLVDQKQYTYLEGEARIGRDIQARQDAFGVVHEFTESVYRDFEVIVVLDHPVDDVADLISEYSAELDIRVLKLENATGCAAARNLGIAAAKGDYVYFLDSDDYLYPGALFFLAESASVTDDPDIVYGKKHWTWYSRSGYIALNTKNGALSSSLESGNDADSADETDGDSGDGDDFVDSTKSSGAAEDEAAEAAALEEELLYREQVAAKRANRIALREIHINDDAERRRLMSDEEYSDFRRRSPANRLISKRKGIRNVSALHIAYKRELVERVNLRFNESFRYYADLSFVADALYHATTFRRDYRSGYVKRKHNDPINFPSLAQEKSDDRFPEFIAAYVYTRDRLPEESTIRVRVDKKFIYYYTRYFVTRMRRSINDFWRNERFDMMREALNGICDQAYKEVKMYDRRLIRASREGSRKKTHRIVSSKLAVKKFFRCIFNRKTRLRAFYHHIFMKKPVRKDWILFECFFGKSYGDNPKGIYEYIAQNYPGKYRLIWSMEKPLRSRIPFKHKTVKTEGLRYAYYIARCKYIVFNTKQPGWMRKREEQVFLETWHGTPLKRLAFDMEDNFSAAPGYKKSIYSRTRSWDYLVSANAFSSEVFRSCFMFDGNMLEYGYPRNDILHRPDRDELALSIRKKLGIPLDKKTILYAPTWRDDEYYAAGQYKFTLKLELPKLKAALGDEYVILLRTHYYIADKLDVTGMEGFAYNLSKYSDIADIYLISDICITDYSSVFFDYANLKRPMLFYTYDIDKYRDMLRGFYFDMESTVPGPLLYTTEEVIDAIKDIDKVKERFAERYDRFYDRFCGWEDGHASEHIAQDVIINPKIELIGKIGEAEEE